MKLTEVNIDELIPYENNPRRNESAVKPVMESIKAFGFRVPVIVDKDNVIIAGHTRLLAARELGLKKIPVIHADDLTEAQVAAFRLADNKVSEFSGWDFDKLDEELAKIECLDLDKILDMSEFGFDNESNADIDSLFENAPEQHREGAEHHGKTVVCPHCGQEFTV